MCSSYVVLFGVTLILMLEQGTIKCLGVFLPVLQEQFSTYTWVIGLAISFAPGIGSLACLLILPSIRSEGVISPTSWIIVAGIISGLSLIIGSLTSGLVGLVLAFTLEGSLVVAKVVSLGILTTRYYNENIEMVTAIAASGQSIGMMMMPPMTQISMDTYGWRGAMMLLGAMACHIILIGAILRHDESRHSNGYFQQLNEQDNESLSKQCRSYLSNILNLNLLTNIRFINVLIQAAASGWAFTSWMIYLIPHAEEKGIRPSDAVFLATVGGIGNLIGKLCCPVVRNFMPNRATICLGCMLAGVSLGFDSLLDSMAGLLVSSTMFALFIGLAFIASTASINEVVDENHLTDAYAWFFLLYGICSLTGGFITGLLFDVTGSYDISFIVMGSVCMLPTFTVLIESIWTSRISQRIF